MIALLAVVLLASIGLPLFALFGQIALVVYLDPGTSSWSALAFDAFGPSFSDSPTLMAVPLFAFAACMLAKVSSARRVLELGRAWLGWTPGRHALVGVEGAHGQPFPPGTALILYGVVASISLEQLLVASVAPSVLALLAFAVLRARLPARVVGRAPASVDWASVGPTLRAAKWELALPLVLGPALAFDVLRVHEAAAFAVIYVLLVQQLVHRELHLARDLPRIALEAIALSGALLLLMACALALSAWLVQNDPNLLTAFLSAATTPIAFLLLASALLVLAGMLLDKVGAILLLTPVLLRSAYGHGLAPQQLAIVSLLALEIGSLAAPFAVALLAPSLRSSPPTVELQRPALPRIAVLLLTLLAALLVPALTQGR